MNTKFSLHKATISQVQEIVDLFVKCTDWLIFNEIDQWNYTYPVHDDVSNDINNDELRVVKIDDRIAGVITMNAQQDTQYENITWKYHSVRVCVMHRLAVHPDFHKQGVGQFLISYADNYAKSYEYEVIRLDAYSGNSISNQLYQTNGYEQAEGFCYFHGNKVPFNCWEKKI